MKVVDNSYDVPSSNTTTTDPYTGKQTVTTHPGYHVANNSVEVSVKNQRFSPYSIDSEHTVYLYYNVSYKGHYAPEWTYYPSGYYARDNYSPTNILQTTSDYTVVQFNTPSEGQMDYRVQAQIGYYNEHYDWTPIPGAPFTYYEFIGASSGFSDIQTIDLGNGTVVVSPNTSTPPTITLVPSASLTSTPTQASTTTSPTPAVPELSALILTPLLAAVLLALLTFKLKSKKGW